MSRTILVDALPSAAEQAEHRAKQPPLMDLLYTSLDRELDLMAKGAAECKRIAREEGK